MFAEKIFTQEIDTCNAQFTQSVKNRLNDLTVFSEKALEWLMVEHYQFSAKNTQFLLTAVTTTKPFHIAGVSAELLRNFNEEKNHAALYKQALWEMGTDVNQRIEFLPTAEFFVSIAKLITVCPSKTLGAMYATEAAAIFEHVVFWNISHEVARRRNKPWESSKLKAFHDLHLNGVEQGHKDGLGLFVNIAQPNVLKPEQLLHHAKVLLGAQQAIHAMTLWWNALLERAQTII